MGRRQFWKNKVRGSTPVQSTPKIELGQAYPNPATSQITIPFTLLESETVDLEIYSSIGYYYSTQSSFSAGVQAFNVTGFSDLPSGAIFFFRLKTDESTALGSFIKQ